MLNRSNLWRAVALCTTVMCIATERVTAQSFTGTGPTGTFRSTATSTLLPNGKILVAGGTLFTFGAPFGTTNAEVFDPATGAFTATGSMNVPRASHTATLLSNGKVLIAGGRNGTAFGVATAEIYDPAAGTFTATNAMNTPRSCHTATLLPNGQVLIAGGMDTSTNAVATAELYNPATGIFTSTSSPMTAARQSHSASLLDKSQVLIAGGTTGIFGIAIANADIFNLTTGTFTATHSMATARAFHTATTLPKGQVLIAGGVGPFGPLSSTELYDPKTGVFSASGRLTTARQGATATLLDRGEVLIAGGFGLDQFSIFVPLGSAELYDPKSGTSSSTRSMINARQGHTATLLGNGEVLIAGGSTYSVAELFNPKGAVCTPGAAGCGWHFGDMLTLFRNNGQSNYWGILQSDFDSVYVAFGGAIVGDPAIFTMVFTDGSSAVAYLPAIGPAAPLNGSAANPTSTASGIYGGDVFTLKLNIDFSDAGLALGSSRIPFGNLTLCNFAAPSLFNGWTIRQVNGAANISLGGGSTIFSIADLDTAAQNLTASFFAGDPTSWAQQHLVNGVCK